MIEGPFQPRRRLSASRLNELARSAESAHLGAAGYLSQENGMEQVARSPRRMSPIVKATPSPPSDGAVIGVIQVGTTGSNVGTGSEPNTSMMTAYVYPNWPEQTGRYLVRVYTPCVYRRAPLLAGDVVLLHPCSIGLTTEGEDS